MAHQGQVLLGSVARKARVILAIVLFPALAIGHLGSEETPSEGAVGNKSNTETSTGREYPVFRVARPQRVLTLQGGDRVYRVRLFDRR